MDGTSHPADTLTLLLRAVRFEAEGINAYELEAPDGADLPPFTAGAHIDLHLLDGLVRSYSLLNDPGERTRYVIGVHHDPNGRGGSRHVHEVLRPGAVLRVARPRNTFPLDEAAERSLFIAGGIGVTPLLCMAARLTALGRQWTMHYATRTRARTAFTARLQALAGHVPGRVRHYHDGEPDGSALDIVALMRTVPPGTQVYCCGPLPMLEAFEAATRDRPAGQVHTEYFTARQAASTEGGYAVVLGRSGRRVEVAPGQSMLGALLDAGVEVNFSCSEGVCGTCETRVLAGLPEHRDSILTEAEQAGNKTVMVCCSGSRTPELVLDL